MLQQLSQSVDTWARYLVTGDQGPPEQRGHLPGGHHSERCGQNSRHSGQRGDPAAGGAHQRLSLWAGGEVCISLLSLLSLSFCLCLFYRLSLSVPSGSLSLSIVSVCLCWQFVSVCQLALSVPSVSLSLSVSAVSLSLSLLLVCLHLFWQFILSVCLFRQFVSVSSVSLPVSSASCLFCQFVSVHSPLCNHHV